MIRNEKYITKVRKELHEHADKSVKNSQLFFKEPVKSYGVKTPIVRSLAKKLLKEIKYKGKDYIFDLCDELWKSDYIEESIIACDLSYSQKKVFGPCDIILFEKWIYKYVSNWASCDAFCNNSIGEFLLQYPEYIVHLKKWATSNNRWVRRAAAVSLILPARRGLYLKDMLDIATIELEDSDDLVQKGYGWMLKVASKKNEKAIFDFVMEHKTTMPRTALRYAIEHMPIALKTKAMAK